MLNTKNQHDPSPQPSLKNRLIAILEGLPAADRRHLTNQIREIIATTESLQKADLYDKSDRPRSKKKWQLLGGN